MFGSSSRAEQMRVLSGLGTFYFYLEEYTAFARSYSDVLTFNCCNQGPGRHEEFDVRQGLAVALARNVCNWEGNYEQAQIIFESNL